MGDYWYMNKCKCVRDCDGGGESEINKTKKKILLRAVHAVKTAKHSPLICNSSYSEYQILDLDTGEFSRTPFTLLGDSGIGTILLLGSSVYTVGKRKNGSGPPDYSQYFSHVKDADDIVAHHDTGLSFFDMARPELGWSKGPLVKEDLYHPNCADLGGKIYAFRSSHFCCFGEVYDPKLNSWHPLPGPPLSGEYKVVPPLVADPSQGRVLVNFDDLSCRPVARFSRIYAYYPGDARWECVVEDFDEAWGGWAGPLALVDGVIYFFVRKCRKLIQAYDLHNKVWLEVVLTSEFDKDYSRCNFNALHHLGNGLMCFTTYTYSLRNLDPTVINNHTVLLALQFRVERASAKQHPGQVLVTPVSSRSCPMQSVCQIHGQIAI